MLSVVDNVATRGGLETRVGITSPEACRCESVTEPSEFPHIMTMGVLDIWVPKPLKTRQGRRRWTQEVYRHAHPPHGALASAGQSVCGSTLVTGGRDAQRTHIAPLNR